MVEKPISVHVNDAQKLIDASKNKSLVFGAMFNMRTNPCFFKLKDLLDRGELGEITRINWIITDWFRPQSYYDSGNWRATWKGEGGGVLMNQCPHQLDLLQWLFGMPSKVRAFCGIGKYHNIEVEDAVTAYLEYPNGATGVFITTTGETPGTNRLEVCGENGRVVVENGTLKWTRNTVGQSEYSKSAPISFSRPDVWNIDIPCGDGWGTQHAGIFQNFIDAIYEKKKLIAPAPEGIKSVALANAMILSSFKGKTIDIPLDSNEYEALLMKLVETSVVKTKCENDSTATDMSASFSKK